MKELTETQKQPTQPAETMKSIYDINRYSNRVLELIEHKDDFTTSDLQGIVETLIINIYYHK